MAFPGTFLAVSHDRYFLDKVANCTLELEDGELTEYGGNYSYYKEKKAAAKAERLARVLPNTLYPRAGNNQQNEKVAPGG